MVPSTKVSRLHTLFSIHNAATSENVVKAKFGEYPSYEVE